MYLCICIFPVFSNLVIFRHISWEKSCVQRRHPTSWTTKTRRNTLITTHQNSVSSSSNWSTRPTWSFQLLNFDFFQAFVSLHADNTVWNMGKKAKVPPYSIICSFTYVQSWACIQLIQIHTQCCMVQLLLSFWYEARSVASLKLLFMKIFWPSR